MKKIAYILSFIFLSFVAGPTVITLIDDSVDISFAFTVNEEENTSKNIIPVDVTEDSNHQSIEYLRTHCENNFYFQMKHYQVHLDVTSPPPKFS